jgi:hypothetical protein
MIGARPVERDSVKMGESVRLFVSGDRIADMEFIRCAMRLA